MSEDVQKTFFWTRFVFKMAKMRYAAAAQATTRVAIDTGILRDWLPTGTEIVVGPSKFWNGREIGNENLIE